MVTGSVPTSLSVCTITTTITTSISNNGVHEGYYIRRKFNILLKVSCRLIYLSCHTYFGDSFGSLQLKEIYLTFVQRSIGNSLRWYAFITDSTGYKSQKVTPTQG